MQETLQKNVLLTGFTPETYNFNNPSNLLFDNNNKIINRMELCEGRTICSAKTLKGITYKHRATFKQIHLKDMQMEALHFVRALTQTLKVVFKERKTINIL